MKIGVYKSCSELPLNRFIDVLVSGDVKRLVVFGIYKPSYLKKLWDDIFEEYISMTRDTSHAHMLTMMREYGVLSNKVDIVREVVNLLKIRHHDGLVQVLRNMGFNYKFTEKTLKKDLENVVSKAKLWVFRANKVLKQLNDQPKNSTVQRSDFDEILAELSAFQGYHIQPDKITVSQYVSALNRFKKHVEDGKRRKNNRNN